jgi:hypothetical protein
VSEALGDPLIQGGHGDMEAIIEIIEVPFVYECFGFVSVSFKCSRLPPG